MKNEEKNISFVFPPLIKGRVGWGFAFLFFPIFFFLGAHTASATDYYKEGSVVSTNLLTGLTDVGAITQFTATASIGAGERIYVQFSRNKLQWYDSANTAYATTTLANGANTIDITALNWSGPVFYYRLIFHRNTLTATPSVTDVSVDYTQVAGPTYDYYTEGTLVSTNLLDGLTNVGAITQFSASASIASGETITVQFSRDKITWYDGAGTAWAETSLSNGSNNVSLSALGWSGPLIYYKLHFTTNDPGITPNVTSVSVDYTAGSGSVMYKQGAIVSTNILSGQTLAGNEFFGYSISSLPSGTSVSVQFSTSTNGDWYGSNGTKWDSDTLSSGSHLSQGTAINLSALNLSSYTSFYYKFEFTTNDNTNTPAVTRIILFSSGEIIPVDRSTVSNVKIRGGGSGGGSVKIRGGSAGGGASAVAYLLSENFDGSSACGDGVGTNCQLAWTLDNTPTLVFNYTTSPAPLEGTKSLLIGPNNASNEKIQHTFSVQDKVYFFFMVNHKVTTGGSEIFALVDDNLDGGPSISNGNPEWRMFCGSVAVYGDPIVQGTTYYVWGDYTKGTGSNAVCNLYYSTTSTKPASPNLTISNGDATTQTNIILLESSAIGTETIFDKVRVSTSVIGDNGDITGGGGGAGGNVKFR